MAKTEETTTKEKYISQEKKPVLMAKKVLEKIGRGENVVYGEVAKEVGYSDTMALNPQAITRTVAYRKAIEEFLPVAEKARQNAILAISKRNMNKERLPSVVDAMDKLTKNIQLLSGQSTDNQAVQVAWSDTPKDTQ